MKRLLTILVVGIFIVGSVLFFGLGFIVKAAIENVAPQITKTDVSVANVIMSPLSGVAKIKGLTIGNPEGYTSDHLLQVGSISVKLDVASLMSDNIVVNELRIEDAEVIYEGDFQNSNLKALQKTVGGEASSSAASTNSGAASASSQPAKTFAIEQIYINGTKVNYSSPLLAGKDVSFEVSNIHLENVGTKDKGATAAEVVNKIMVPLFNNIYKAATGTIKGLKGFNADSLSNKAEDAVKSLKKGLGGLFSN